MKEPFLNNFKNWGEVFDTFIHPKFKIEKVIFDNGRGDLYSHPKKGSIKKGDYFIIVGNLKGGKNFAYKYKEPTEVDIRENNHTVIYTPSFAWRRKSFINAPPSVTKLFGSKIENEEKTYKEWMDNVDLFATGSNMYWDKDAEFYIINLHLVSNKFLNWNNDNPLEVKE